MNLKRFSIISAIIVGLVLVATIVLSCVKIDNPLQIATADKITVYSQTSAGVDFSMKDTPAKYKRLVKEVENMTKLTIFDCMLKDYDLKREPSQDVDKKYPTFDKSKTTTEKYCVELVFDEEQEMKVVVDQDTKVIKFTALIFALSSENSGQELALYYSTTGVNEDYKTYTTQPILIKAKTNKILEYIKSEGFKN